MATWEAELQTSVKCNARAGRSRRRLTLITLLTMAAPPTALTKVITFLHCLWRARNPTAAAVKRLIIVVPPSAEMSLAD